MPAERAAATIAKPIVIFRSAWIGAAATVIDKV
jgi:acetyltransferase-like isoleucine patch superfamily enzyme